MLLLPFSSSQLLLLGTAIYLVISTGSIEGAVKKAKQFVTVEWANYLGRRKKSNYSK